MKRRVPTFALAVLFLVSAYAAWDNVLSDNTEVRNAAEAKACEKKKCDEKHGLTKTDRTPFGQTFEYTWHNGVVAVECKRGAWIFGARECQVR